ncbi:LD-carboxypeptidase [Adhaeribacter arboris]|uniref:LD-carboxypeptidase n=1 Tax=Adhaeribacter arboris TaxID=2072846 RepID=UPI0021CEED6C|nr:LD-carboxypeptidase [Adhaeribacter arboris]
MPETFKLEVVENTHTLRSADFISKNPQAQADDLMEAFSDKLMKTIIFNIGGESSSRTLPYTDLAVIKVNPKIFLGFSGTIITLFACYKASITSFHSTSLLVGFAKNGGMHSY